MKIIGQINNYFKQCFENADHCCPVKIRIIWFNLLITN